MAGGFWPITVRAHTASGAAVDGTVSYAFLFGGSVVAKRPGGHMGGGVFRDRLEFTAQSVGYPLTVQVVVRGAGRRERHGRARCVRAAIAPDGLRTGDLPPAARLGRRAPRSRRQGAGARRPRHAPLAAVLVLSATLNCFALAKNGYANSFYSAGCEVDARVVSQLRLQLLRPRRADHRSTSLRWRCGYRSRAPRSSASRPLPLLLPEALAGTLAVAALYFAMVRGRSAAPPRWSARSRWRSHRRSWRSPATTDPTRC